MATQSTEVFEKFGGAPHSKQSLRLWLRMLSCTTQIEHMIRTRLREQFDTTLPRFDVLAALDRFPDGLTMGALSRCLMVSNGNVTGVVTRLEQDGLIKRVPLKTDRRTHVVRLTEDGEAAFRDMAQIHEGWIDEMFAAIDSDEADFLLRELRKVQHSLAEYDRKSSGQESA